MRRIVIDAHVHPQRFTPGFLKQGERFTYDKLENEQIAWDEVSLKWSPEHEEQATPAGGRSEGGPVCG